MITVSNDVQVYEVDAVEVTGKGKLMGVASHVTKRKMVVIIVDGTEYTVLASDMKAAIDNALNSNA